jgi:hypothetical protein
MMKMVVRAKGETRLLLGLTRENVDRMMAGEPVLVKLADLGLAFARPPGPGEVLFEMEAGVIAIDYGNTLAELQTRWGLAAAAVRTTDGGDQRIDEAEASRLTPAGDDGGGDDGPG